MPRPVDLSSNLRDVEKNGAKKKEEKKKAGNFNSLAVF